MHVGALWRYPVKSLRGEPLHCAELRLDGVRGDRLVHVRNDRGPLTGRSRPGLLTLPATTRPDGVPLVAGHAWDSAEAAHLILRHGGADARLSAYAGPERFDVLNLLVATGSAARALGIQARRLRPNLLLDDVPAGAERTWAGKALLIGDALIGIHGLRERCVVTTIDPDTGVQDVTVLKRINHDFDGRIGLDSWVIRPGRIAIGDEARLVDAPGQASHLGGWVTGLPYRVSSESRNARASPGGRR